MSVAEDGTLGNDYSVEPSISYDGRRVAFTTWADNLFPDTKGHTLDVVVKDLATGELHVVSQSTDGRQSGRNSFFPVMAGGGRYVAFQTFGAFGPKDADRVEVGRRVSPHVRIAFEVDDVATCTQELTRPAPKGHPPGRTGMPASMKPRVRWVVAEEADARP